MAFFFFFFSLSLSLSLSLLRVYFSPRGCPRIQLSWSAECFTACQWYFFWSLLSSCVFLLLVFLFLVSGNLGNLGSSTTWQSFNIILATMAGVQICFCPKPRLSEHYFVQQSAYDLFLKPRQKGCNFQFKMLNILYSLDNVSNINWTKWLYLLIKIQIVQ